MKTILVVDDEPRARQLYRDTLEEEGYMVLEAEGAGAALEHLRTHRVDLAILDIFMPGTHGLELLTQLRQTHPRLPVIICSALGALFDDYAIWEARDQIAGMFEKPVDIQTIVRCVAQALQTPRVSSSS